MPTLPMPLYSSQEVKRLDTLLVQQSNGDNYDLMYRAGQSAFELFKTRYSSARRIAIFCGPGNNGGDGFVFAKIAHDQGFEVRVYDIVPVVMARLSPGAHKARAAWAETNQSIFKLADQSTPWPADVMVDAMLGTGLNRPIDPAYLEAITLLNQPKSPPVLALDVPTGLDASTGEIVDSAVQADTTLTFLGLKAGLFCGKAYDYVGELFFDDLGIAPHFFDQVKPIATRFDYENVTPLIPKKTCTQYKGLNGHVLIIGGGELHYAGAPVLSAEAAYRSGAGLVSLYTTETALPLMARTTPELMIYTDTSKRCLDNLLEKVDVILIGPGLGTNKWSKKMFQRILASKKPMVVDADALNLLATKPQSHTNWILTPHPGEAARLLNCPTHEVQANRIQKILELQHKYKGTIVLKGPGTLITSGETPLLYGQSIPALATAGTGDVLAGIIVGLCAQGLSLEDAAQLGVAVHGQAGLSETLLGDRGMMANDLFLHIRSLLCRPS